MENKPRLYIFYIIFAFSGFSGLIYESIWTHYLKLFLGHASYSQALVLIIFMGGMATGAWIISKINSKIKNPLFLYALIEGIIGFLALFFHVFFTTSVNFLYDYFLTVSSPFIIEIIKWGFSVLLILPQSILLGMTFPLMTGGILRKYENVGKIISTLYFSNSFGAVLGVLSSGLVLIQKYGLNKTIQIAGYLNIVIMIFMIILSLNKDDKNLLKEDRNNKDDADINFIFKLFLITSALTGFSSFIYEISWIRMLSLVLGSTSYAFELMLSSFILGIALGGFWIRKRIDNYTSPVKSLGRVQITMGVLGISTIVFYNLTFAVMKNIIYGTAKTSEGYFIYNLFQWILSVFMMLPTTFFAGMTLPLIIYIMIKNNNGEKSIGQVYSGNTIGSIAGVLMAIFILLPVLGLKYSIIFGGMTDIILGFYLLLYHEKWRFSEIKKLFIIIISVVLGISVFFSFDKFKMASGGFTVNRYYNPETDKVIFHEDGETATIDIVKIIREKYNIFLVITNGKIDAGISTDKKNRESDEKTMYLLGLAPEMLKLNENVAVIGMGSGISSHMALSSDKLKNIDTVEIEKAMVKAIRNIKKYNYRVFNDKRSHIHIEDAKTFFVKNKKKYDSIISEPSNPWISGISSLFSKEYYHNMKKYLKKDGALIQWVQQYSINIKLFSSIVKAFSESFKYCDFYFTMQADLMLVISDKKYKLDFKLLNPDARKDLSEVKINNSRDLYWKYIGSLESLLPYFSFFSIEANSDYYPVLNYGAIKAKFMGNSMYSKMTELITYGIPVIKILENRDIDPYFNENITLDKTYIVTKFVKDSENIYEYLIKGRKNIEFLDKNIKNVLLKIESNKLNKSNYLLEEYFLLANSVNQYLPKEKSSEIWNLLSENINDSNKDEVLNKWILLFKANAAQDFKNMVKYSEEFILSSKTLKSENEKDNYLLVSYMLGQIKLKNYDMVLKYWKKYKTDKLPVIVKVLYQYNYYYSKKK